MREYEKFNLKSTTIMGNQGIAIMKYDPEACIVVSVAEMKDIIAAIEATRETSVVLSTYRGNSGGILGIHVPLEGDVKGTVPIFVVTGRVVMSHNSVESQKRFCDIVEKERGMRESNPKGEE